MEYLLDTDWAIHAFGGRHRAATLLDRLVPERVAVSLVSVGELYDGAYGYANHQAHLERIREFLASFTITGLNDPIMQTFGELRSQLRRAGRPIPDFDLAIASTALYYDLTLLTFNRRHFERIPDLRLYQPSS